jgi:hypothetical protein
MNIIRGNYYSYKQGATQALLINQQNDGIYLDELIAGFPHSSLPKVTGEPTFEDLKVIRRLLNTDAMSVSSYEGGGCHGHLRIIMTNEEYFAVAVDVFPVPNNPGPSAAVVAGMMAAVIAETTRLHKEATQVYRT